MIGRVELDREAAIVAAVRAIAQELRTGLLPTIAEGHIRVVVLEALIREGLTLREGGYDSKVDKLLRLTSGRVSVRRVPRIKARAVEGLGGNFHTVDVRVEEPIKLSLLLKVASSHGVRDYLVHKLIRKDVDQIRGGGADALIIATDRKPYDVFRGDRRVRAERSAEGPNQFAVIFPASHSIGEGEVGRDSIVREPDASWLAVRTGGATDTERLVLAWWPELGRDEPKTATEQMATASSPSKDCPLARVAAVEVCG
jgi:hypothetical protein